MKISSKGRYGLRAMFELALHYDSGSIPLKIIAQKQELSENYLEQIFAVLRRSGLVKSIRGAQGGYRLAKKPAQITVGEIVRALEGPLELVECVKGDKEDATCYRADECVTRMIWAKLRDKINEVLDSTTLADMCEEMEKNKGHSCCYATFYL